MNSPALDIPAAAAAELDRLAPNVRRRFEAALAGPDAGCALEQLQRLADARQRGPGPAVPQPVKPCDPWVVPDDSTLRRLKLEKPY